MCLLEGDGEESTVFWITVTASVKVREQCAGERYVWIMKMTGWE